VTDGPRDEPLNVRPPREDRLAGYRLLSDRGWDMTSFIAACLKALRADPDRILAFLDPHRIERRGRGRPRKDTQ
jgi:hypothetical protein